jgi:hypothetical protein
VGLTSGVSDGVCLDYVLNVGAHFPVLSVCVFRSSYS